MARFQHMAHMTYDTLAGSNLAD